MPLLSLFAVILFNVPNRTSVHLPSPLLSVRIGLVRSFSGATSFQVSVPPSVRLTDPLDSTLLEGAAEWRVIRDQDQIRVLGKDDKPLISGPILRLVSERNVDCPPILLTAGQVKRKYRGVIEFQAGRISGTVLAINELPLEQYLRGVVPAEMSDTAPLEALKAQTIAARTYALINRGRYRTRGYDLTDASDCQVYNGAGAEKSTSDTAIRETAGQVLVRNGALVLADYYDDCGGMTSPGESVGDYPPSVPDSVDGGRDFCEHASYHHWQLTLAPSQVASLLNAGEKAKVGEVADVSVDKTDSSGRAVDVVVSGSAGSVHLKGSSLRRRLGYSRMKSTMITLTKDVDGSFVMEGRGYGHGHGLCQAGAMGMAAAPYNKSCAEILEHYFPGSEIVEFTDQSARPQTNPDEARGTLPSRHGTRRGTGSLRMGGARPRG